MGMYTEIYVNVDLKKDVPQKVLDELQAICNKEFKSELFAGRPHRWGLLFNNGSCYFPCTESGQLTKAEYSNYWSLLGKGDLKNYSGEIETFFEWIMPYIDAPEGQFIGYSRYEEDLKPTLYFKQGE